MSQKPTSRASKIVLWSVLGGAIAVAGAGVAYVGIAKWRDSDAAKARETGFALFDEGRFAEALPSLSKAVARDREKKDAEALRRLARARLMVPEPNGAHLPAAARFFQSAVLADPDDLASRRTMLEIFGRIGQQFEAESVAKEILARDPDDGFAREALVQLALVQGKQDAAIELLTERARTSPQDLEAKLRLVEVSLAAGRPPQQVLETVERWLAEPDADRVLRVARIAVLQRLGEQAAVAAEVGELAGIEPRSTSGCLVLARVLGLTGTPAAAKKVLLDGAARIDGAASRLAGEAARVSLLDDDLDAASRAIALADGEDGATWVPRARMRVAYLRGDAAELGRLVTAGGGAAAAEDLRYGTALLGALSEKPTTAEATAIADALETDPDDFVLLAAQARLRSASGDLAGATTALSRAFDASGRAWVRGAAMLAPALEASGDRARAVAVIRDLVSKQPGNPMAQAMILGVAAEASLRGEPVPIPGLDLARAAADLSGAWRSNSELLPLAVIALVGVGRGDDAAALVEESIGGDRIDGPTLVAVARACAGIGAGVPRLSTLVPRVLDAAAARGADARVVETMRARTGSADSLASLVAMADAGDVTALRSAAMLADAQMLPEARRLLERLLEKDAAIDGRLLVLGSQCAAREPDLLEKAIASIEGTGGATDATVAARARLLLLKKGAPSRAEIDEALASLDDLRKRKGDSAETLATMARLLLVADASDPASALRLATQAADLAPDRAQVQLLAAAIAAAAKDAPRAREYLGRVVKLVDQESISPAAGLLVAAQHSELGDHAEAARLAMRGAEAVGRSDAFLDAAARAAAAGDDATRERALRAAVAAGDAAPLASARLALFLGGSGRIDEARKVVDALASRVPESQALPVRLELELSYGDRTAATAALDAALARAPDPRIPEARLLLALKALERRSAGDLAAAVECAQRLAAAEPTNGAAIEVALSASARADATGDAALAILDGAGVPAAPILRELRAMRDGKAPASTAKARELAARAPKLWLAWAMAMDVAANLGDPEQRAAIAASAARELPGDATALYVLASLMIELGRGDAALAAVEQMRGLPAADRATVERLASLALIAMKDVDEAKRVAARFHEATGNPDAAMLAASIDAQRGDVAAGYARVKELVGGSPQALQAWLSRSMTLSPKDARQMIELASEHEARMPLVFAGSWSALAVRGGLNAADRARAILDRTPADPSRPLFRAAVEAEIALARGDAASIASSRAALAAQLPEAIRGVLEGRRAPAGDSSEAGRFAAEIAATEALLLVERTRDLDRALALSDAASSLVDLPAYRLIRGRALLARNEPAKALEIGERLATESPLNAEAWLLVANARLKSGDPQGALKAVAQGQEAAARALFVEPRIVQNLGAVEALARSASEADG